MKKEDVLLTPKEKDKLWDKYKSEDPLQKTSWGIVVSQAEFKKVMEWGEGGCPHGGCLPDGHYELKRNRCLECWQDLQKIAEEI